MSISLRDITQDNFNTCMRLSVRKDQPFVASNAYSVAESKLFPQWITKAIYSDEEMVGFMMYEMNYEENELYLCRFMIDQNHQGKGYGKAALDLLKEIAMEDEKINQIKLSTAPDNQNGIRIYEKFGFVDMKYMEDDEEVFVLHLKK
ncbi:MAG: GNAT family N-acetyltransferase [Anaerolineae bacterium]|nr:GNAT family N-acetyltransferase [Anaerolineae bacterium]